MYFVCQCSSARCSRLLLDRSTLLGIFSAEIIAGSPLHTTTVDTKDSMLFWKSQKTLCPLCPSWLFESRVSSPLLRTLPIELGSALFSVHLQRALVADRVRPLKDPVLPRRQPPEDLRLHRLGAGESEVGLEAGHRVGRERRARLDREPHLVVPV